MEKNTTTKKNVCPHCKKHEGILNFAAGNRFKCPSCAGTWVNRNEAVPSPSATEIDLLEGEDKPVMPRGEDSKSPIAFEDIAEPDTTLEDERKAVFDSGLFQWEVFVETDDGEVREKINLHPYSVTRDSQFSRMRHAMGAPDIKEAIMDLSLFVGDAHLILFLCSHDERYIASRMNQPAEFLVTMFEWADKNIKVGETDKAVTTALNIFFQKNTNQAEQAPSDDPHAPSELGN